MAAKTNLNKYVRVLWEDAWNGNGSYFTADSVSRATPLLLECSGYCIRDNKDGISMASTVPIDGNYGPPEYRHVQHIPRAMVRKVSVLR